MRAFLPRQLFLFASISVGGFLLFIFTAKPALADPHALFYTSTGQQQLFFNVLAALDQADYVEPAENTTGTPSGQSREELLQAREAAGFPATSDPWLDATQTDLASVLTRGVTLEGHDMWSAYLLHQSALERRRREDVNAIVNALCDVGLSSCEGQTQNAFVTNPTEQSAETLSRGVNSILASNADPNSEDQQMRREEIRRRNQGEDVRPRAWDSFMASLRQHISDSEEDEAKAHDLALQRVVGNVSRSFGQGYVDPTTFDEFTAEGEAAPTQADSDFSFTRFVTTSATKILNLPITTMATAQRGFHQIASFQALEQQDGGARANSTISVEAEGETIKSLSGRVTVPAHVKTAATQAGLNTAGAAAANYEYASTEYTREGETAVEDTPLGDIQIINQSDECFAPGQQFRLAFTVQNRSGNPARGIVGAVTYGVVNGTRVVLQNPSTSPAANETRNGRFEWNGQNIGTGSYSVTGTVRPDYEVRVLQFILRFRYTERSGGQIVGPRTVVAIPRCGSGSVAGITTIPETNGAGRVLAGTDAFNTPSSGQGERQNPAINPAPVTLEPGISNIFNAIYGEGTRSRSLFESALQQFSD